MTPRLWTPEIVRPEMPVVDGALRNLRRREQERSRRIRDPRVDPWLADSIAFDTATDGLNNGGTTNSLSFSHTCTGSNRYLLVGFQGDVQGGNDDVTAVTYAGVAMTLITKLTSGNNRILYAYGMQGPASGSNTVQITCTNNHYILGCAASYTGVKQTTMSTTIPGCADNYSSSSSAAGALTWTSTVTTLNDNCWSLLVDAQFDANNPPLAGTGSTRRVYGAAFGEPAIFDSNGPITPAGNYSMTTNQNANISAITIDHIIISIAPETGVAVGYLLVAN